MSDRRRSSRPQGSDPLPAPEGKVAYVRQMFGRIARHYDRMNRVIALGRDQAWRRYAVTEALASPTLAQTAPGTTAVRVLDVATGTGDLALEALRQLPGALVVGLDFVPEMLARAQDKAKQEQVPLALAVGDALHLPFADGSFDAVLTGFAMRNVTDIPAALAEMARLTRPGGRLACLEIAKPRLPVFRCLFVLYFFGLVPLLGRLLARESLAYTYLPHSLTAFLTPDQIAAVMRQVGWRDVRYKRLMLGTVAVHVGVRA